MKFNDYLQEVKQENDEIGVGNHLWEVISMLEADYLDEFLSKFDKDNKTNYNKRIEMVKKDLEKIANDFEKSING